MDFHLRHVAGVLAGRHVRYASLAIMPISVARIDDPFIALTAGGLLNLAMGAVWRAGFAGRSG